MIKDIILRCSKEVLSTVWISDNIEHIRLNIKDTTSEMLDSLLIEEVPLFVNHSDEFVFKTGSVIKLIHIYNIEKIRGYSFNIIILDETVELTENELLEFLFQDYKTALEVEGLE